MISKEIVFLVCDDLDPGGAERQCLLLARELTIDWNPMLISFSDGPLHEDYTNAGIPVFLISRTVRYDVLGPFVKLMKLTNSHHPTILHSWGWMSTILSAIVARIMGIPQISSTIRMGMVPENANLFSKFAAKLGAYSVANSRAGLKAWNVPIKKGTVIYNGFDWTRIQYLDNVHRKQDEYRVLMIASMSPLKDWNSFVSVARIVHREDTGIHFYGYGNGMNRKRILANAEDLQEKGIVFLPGATLNPIKECLNSDIGVLLSTFGEGTSNSIMEYMACGLPVICSNSGGNPELVVDGITGFLVDPENNPEQIAEKILWLKNNPRKALIMGKAGKDRIKTLFSTEKMLRGFVDLYNQSMNGNS